MGSIGVGGRMTRVRRGVVIVRVRGRRAEQQGLVFWPVVGRLTMHICRYGYRLVRRQRRIIMETYGMTFMIARF